MTVCVCAENVCVGGRKPFSKRDTQKIRYKILPETEGHF